MKDKKKIILPVIVGILVMILIGVSYAFFNYTRTGNVNTVKTGRISFNMTQSTISLENVYPISSTQASTDTTNAKTISITVVGDTDYDEGMEYLVTASDVNLEANGKTLPIALEVSVTGDGLGTIETGDYYTNRESYSESKYKIEYTNLEEGKHILVGYISPNTTKGTIEGVNGIINIKTYIDSSKVLISDTWNNGNTPTDNLGTPLELGEDKTVFTTTEWNNITGTNALSFKIKVEAREGLWVEAPLTGSQKVLKAINSNATGTCQDIIYEEDGIKYFSGTNDCINFNYVWYSGKLWRITAIYPDGSMKLITENNITSISYNASGQVNFYTDENTKSYMYQWLNEEFYPTLYNASEFIDTTKKWNANMPADTNISTKPGNTNLVDSNVGLLNSYEYYNSYRNLGSYSNGYLNIGYYWWLLNPYNASNVWRVNRSGDAGYYNPTNTYGGRPSIYLKSGLEFTGNGTTSEPYKIVGDKDAGSVNDYVNTRLSGEYVKLKNGSNEQLFRIIDVEDNRTKIIAMDYADNKGARKFATSIDSADALWGSGTTTDTDTWYDYLNNTYLPNLKTTYNELFDSGTYYLGASGYNYKLSVCANATSGNTKECAKTTQSGTFNIGLPRYGEMFATQQSGGYSNSMDMWLINRYSASSVWFVGNIGNVGIKNQTSTLGGRPTLHLKSTVKILTCDSDICDGTQNHPYVVGL